MRLYVLSRVRCLRKGFALDMLRALLWIIVETSLNEHQYRIGVH